MCDVPKGGSVSRAAPYIQTYQYPVPRPGAPSLPFETEVCLTVVRDGEDIDLTVQCSVWCEHGTDVLSVMLDNGTTPPVGWTGVLTLAEEREIAAQGWDHLLSAEDRWLR